jgi:hypothetical protein
MSTAFKASVTTIGTFVVCWSSHSWSVSIISGTFDYLCLYVPNIEVDKLWWRIEGKHDYRRKNYICEAGSAEGD